MSGRDHEPVAAFFPSIDRNLIRDLDRQLRNTRPQVEPSFAPEPEAQRAADFPVKGETPQARATMRPKIASVVEAVEHAAQSIAAMTARIEDLEGHIELVESTNRQLEAQLDEATHSARNFEGRLKTETERATRLETAGGQQAARVLDLERELSTVHSDLARVTEAIAAALGLPED